MLIIGLLHQQDQNYDTILLFFIFQFYKTLSTIRPKIRCPFFTVKLLPTLAQYIRTDNILHSTYLGSMSPKHRSINHQAFSKPTETRSNLKPYLAWTRTLLTQKTINLTHPTSRNAGYDRKAMYRGALNRSLGGRVLATVRTRFLTRERSKKRKKRRRNRLAHSVNRERRT